MSTNIDTHGQILSSFDQILTQYWQALTNTCVFSKGHVHISNIVFQDVASGACLFILITTWISIFILISILILIFISLLTWISRIVKGIDYCLLGIPYWVSPIRYSLLAICIFSGEIRDFCTKVEQPSKKQSRPSQGPGVGSGAGCRSLENHVFH